MKIKYKRSYNLTLGSFESLNYPNAPDDDIYCEYLFEPANGTEVSELVSLNQTCLHDQCHLQLFPCNSGGNLCLKGTT